MFFLLTRVSGTLKSVEYAGKKRFSKYCRFLGLNRPWSLVITHSHLTWTIICLTHTLCIHFPGCFPMRIFSTVVEYLTGWLTAFEIFSRPNFKVVFDQETAIFWKTFFTSVFYWFQSTGNDSGLQIFIFSKLY